jgi:hypothetical protein
LIAPRFKRRPMFLVSLIDIYKLDIEKLHFRPVLSLYVLVVLVGWTAATAQFAKTQNHAWALTVLAFVSFLTISRPPDVCPVDSYSCSVQRMAWDTVFLLIVSFADVVNVWSLISKRSLFNGIVPIPFTCQGDRPLLVVRPHVHILQPARESYWVA